MSQPSTRAAATSHPEISCLSNATHIAWPCRCVCFDDDDDKTETRVLFGYNDDDEENDEEDCCPAGQECLWETRREAERHALEFLQSHVMPWDAMNAASLGYVLDDDDDGTNVDGLDDSIVAASIQHALNVKVDHPAWTSHVPRRIYYEYVMNPIHVNEARTHWRPLYWSRAVQPLLQQYVPQNDNEEVSVNNVVKVLNTHLWTQLSLCFNNKSCTPLHFVSGQTPLIYDPLSVLAYGYASCTGMSIVFANALRAAGIPARLAGTPAWHNDTAEGNHNWVEVWRFGKQGGWSFMEPTVLAAPENVDPDHLDKNPCTRWFCHKDRFDGKTTQVYAARLMASDKPGLYYPMAWDVDNRHVPGDNRTEYYNDICSQC